MTSRATRVPGASIRVMERADVPVVVSIEERVFPTPWSAETFESLVGRSGSGLELRVLETEEAGVVAYAVLWCILDQGELANIAVAPEFRGRGLAAALMTSLLADARARGVASIFLEVRESNERAAELYRGFDFEEVGRRRAYYDRPREDAIVMRLDL